jgi:NADH-quinone oxidoreductase subunit C
LGVVVKKANVISGFEVEVEVLSKNLYAILFYINKHTLFRYKNLVDIVCYDVLGKVNRFFLVYNLLSINHSMRLRIISRVGSFSDVLSLAGIYRGATWLEREVFDFFGIFFLANKDLRRILTDYGFKGFPLRKDFPLTGFVDSYYDDIQKKICYRALELAQGYKNFNTKSS